MEVIKFIQSFSNPFLDVFFQLVTMIGEDYFIMFVIAVTFWCVNKDLGYRLGFAYLSGAALNSGLKEIFRAPRPIGQPGIHSFHLETAKGYSFPSGHTQGTAIICGSLINRMRRYPVTVIGILTIILVGISRMYLGVHYPADVVGGAVIGIAWVYASNRMFDYLFYQPRKSVLLFLSVLMIAGTLVVHTADYYKASGVVTSFLLGYIIESRYIRFDVRSSPVNQLIKLATGLGGLLVIKNFLKVLLPQTLWSDFFRYLLIGIWVIVLAPALFKYLFAQKDRIGSNTKG